MEAAMKRGRKLLSNKIDSRKLKPGDHIYVYRALKSYSHHGIFVGGENLEVIHYTKTNVRKSTEKPQNPCPRCGHERNKEGGVVKTCLDCFVSEDNLLGGHSIYLYDYGVSKKHYKLKRSGTCSTSSSSKSPEETIKIATELYLKNGFEEYNLFCNNCENFATYCKTGIRRCEQVEKPIDNAKDVVKVTGAAALGTTLLATAAVAVVLL